MYGRLYCYRILLLYRSTGGWVCRLDGYLIDSMSRCFHYNGNSSVASAVMIKVTLLLTTIATAATNSVTTRTISSANDNDNNNNSNNIAGRGCDSLVS